MPIARQKQLLCKVIKKISVVFELYCDFLLYLSKECKFSVMNEVRYVRRMGC